MNKIIERITLTAVMSLAGIFAVAQQPITVTINGRPVEFTGTPPEMVNGRVLVPLRGVFENMGAYVHWTSATQTVDAQKGNTTVQLQIGNHEARVNGREVGLDVPPELMNDTTLVPLRFISEALGADVDWLDAQQTVAIRVHGNDEHYHPDRPREAKRTQAPPPPPPPHVQGHHWRATFAVNSVLPVRLETSLSSNGNSVGDSFQATLDTHGAPSYRGLPVGTQIIGHVADVERRHGNEPGVIALDFDRIQLPDGRSIAIVARMVGLDNQSVHKDRNGYLIANPAIDRNNSTAAFIGYGAGAGAVIGLASHGHVVRDATIGGAIGAFVSRLGSHPERAQDVRLASGTPMGVRIMRVANIP